MNDNSVSVVMDFSAGIGRTYLPNLFCTVEDRAGIQHYSVGRLYDKHAASSENFRIGVFMYYKDLTPYEYFMPRKIANILNVGWLDKNKLHEKGNVSSEVVEKLARIVLAEGIFESRVNQIRGIRACDLCGLDKFEISFVGKCEIWIPSIEQGMYFAAPATVIHYITDHLYLPPQIYIDSVLRVDLEARFNGQELYNATVRKHAT